MQKSMQQLFEEFIYEAEYLKKVRPSTIRSYTHIWGLFNSIIQNVSLETISQRTVLDFFKQLQERKRIVGKGIVKKGIKKSTVATYWSKLNAFFTWLQQHTYLTDNPLNGLPYPTPSYEDKKYLTKHQIEKIITAIHINHNNEVLILKRNLSIFYLFLFCGLRKNELLQLQVRDIDFQHRMLTIRGETSKSGNTRYIPLHPNLIMILKDYLGIRKTYTTPYLIVSRERDDQFTVHGLKHLTSKLSMKSGVYFHPHQLRHTFAVNFLRSSNNVVKLKQLLGHKSIIMTLAYLRCLPPSELKKDIDSLTIDRFI